MAEEAAIQISDAFDRSTAAAVLRRARAALAGGARRVVLDFSAVASFDSAGVAALLEALKEAGSRGAELRLKGASKELLDYLSLLSVERLLAPEERPASPALFERVGEVALEAGRLMAGCARTAGGCLHSLFVAPFQGDRVRVDRITQELHTAANGAVPIVVLIAFLMGLILAMQAYVQLRVWGAEIFVADAVAVSITTEIGPLMTAILVAARSGSSMTASLGSMVVSEEVDALRQIGINPVHYLVLPRVLSLALAVPMLCILFDIVAMAGGATFAFLVAGIEIEAYRQQTRLALEAGEILLATVKCLIFGALIGTVACALGLGVSEGSEGVGRATTQSVVLSIFLIIVVDSVFVAIQRIGFA